MSLFKLLLFLTIIIRMAFFFFPAFSIDMNDWKGWSVKLERDGPPNFYSKDYFSDYFPGYLYILWISGVFFHFLSLSINSFTFEFFLKFITLFFDVGSALLIYRIVSKYNKRWKYFAPFLYLLNPGILFNNSIWGQIDGIFTFFLLFSAFFLFENKDIKKSMVTMVLGILVKPHSLALVPVLAFNSLKKFSFEKIVKSIILGSIILILLSLPFFSKNPILGLFELSKNSQNVYQYTSLYAFNLWGIVGPWMKDNQIFFFSFKTWGIVLYVLSLVLISLPLRGKVELEKYYFATSLSFFSFFILLTRMHERYLFPFFAFFLITAFIKKAKPLLALYVLTSLLHFINLWFVYYYYNFVYTSSFYSSIILRNVYPFYILINNNFRPLSFLMVILYCLTLFYYLKIYAKKNKA